MLRPFLGDIHDEKFEKHCSIWLQLHSVFFFTFYLAVKKFWVVVVARDVISNMHKFLEY